MTAPADREIDDPSLRMLEFDAEMRRQNHPVVKGLADIGRAIGSTNHKLDEMRELVIETNKERRQQHRELMRAMNIVLIVVGVVDAAIVFGALR